MHQKAFTLIEIVITIGLISLLSVIGLIAYNKVQDTARLTRVNAELKEINTGIINLGLHTQQIPMHYSVNATCVQNLEADLTSCSVGLACTDGNFPNWQGPYTELNLVDPWGSIYQFDPDYRCNTGVEGCEGIADGQFVRAIFSRGPDQVGAYTPDNIVFVLCR
jgi:prepilin-type N-terminal cleavage/methylation domain-containing protein